MAYPECVTLGSGCCEIEAGMALPEGSEKEGGRVGEVNGNRKYTLLKINVELCTTLFPASQCCMLKVENNIE